MPSFKRLIEEQSGSRAAVSSSSVDPSEIVHRVVNVLESQASLSRSKHYKRRVAVLFTKTDIDIVQKELGLSLDDSMPGIRWEDAGMENDERVRAWLRRNEPGFLQLLETRFGDLRFFPVSAMGKDSSSGKAFQPQQVLHPLCWLLSSRQVMAKPQTARFAGRAAEVAAALLVIATFIVPLWLILRETLSRAHF